MVPSLDDDDAGCRTVGAGWGWGREAGGAKAPKNFGRLVNPTSAKGGTDYAHQINSVHTF